MTRDSEELTAQIRFRGGATRTVKVPNRRPAWEAWKTPPELVELIDQLIDDHTYSAIVSILDERGLRTGYGNSFDRRRIKHVIRKHGLRPRFERLRARGS